MVLENVFANEENKRKDQTNNIEKYVAENVFASENKTKLKLI